MADYAVTPLADEIDFSALDYWDVVIVGAGPAGLAAALTTAHRGLTTLVIEAKNSPGGQPQFLYPDKRIVDIPGFPDGISGEELSARVFRQAVAARVQFRFQEELVNIEATDRVEKDTPLQQVITDHNSYLARKVILACGLLHFPRRLPVLDALQSKRIHYRMPRINDLAGHQVVIIGGSDSALDAAVMVLERHGEVDVLARREITGKADSVQRIVQSGGRIWRHTEVLEASLEGEGMQLTLSTGAIMRCDMVIVQIGFLSSDELFQRLKLRRNDDGSLAVDSYYETSRSGVFAVGDVHGDIKLIVVAWAEGIQAAIYAFKEITSPYWLNEKRLRDLKIVLTGEKLAEAALRKKH